MKYCSKCGQKKPLNEFHKHKNRKDGLQSTCKICSAKVQAAYRKTKQGKLNHRATAAKRRKTVKGYLRNIFCGMKTRCNNPNQLRYKDYGGRGIKLKFTSDEFVNYVINELQVDPRGLTIDRINNNGHYEKGNIRFVTAKENCRNRG